MIISRVNPLNGSVSHLDINVTEEQYKAWENGALAQKAFPHLNADDREYIISGITPGTWDEVMYPGEEWED